MLAHKTRKVKNLVQTGAQGALLCLIGGLLLFVLAACAQTQPVSDKAHESEPSSEAMSQSTQSASSDLQSRSSSQATVQKPAAPVVYPTGWLIAETQGIPAGVPVQILQAPYVDIRGHRLGVALSDQEQADERAGWPAATDGMALVQYQGRIESVEYIQLLVNLADLLPQAVFDVVYSYASTSRCAGQDIYGVTGLRLPGYVDGPQHNAYQNSEQFVVPCAFDTFLKAQHASALLADEGYRLLVYDAYRPMVAQRHLVESFEQSFWANEIMQDSLGSWSLDWYVADGASGHNYGADLDVGVCDSAGNPLAMPSAYDAFDEAGHLTYAPMNSYDISPAAYRDAVSSNPACLALHSAMTQAGFTELASEWWHFGDAPTEAELRARVGNGGLDFMAEM